MPELTRNGSIMEGVVVFEPFEVEVLDGKTHIDQLDETLHSGPVDLDELLQLYAVDGNISGEGLFFDDDFNRSLESDYLDDGEEAPRYFDNPNQRLLDADASLIPGSPFSKPAIRPSSRPREPLRIARYASTFSFLVAVGTVIFLFFNAIYTNEGNIGRIIIEMILSLVSFFGLFWNTYFTISSILKCFIPTKAFKTNTKYCSIIPEAKDARDHWLNVTIQIPVYKESLVQVLMPTLRSCVAARVAYETTSQGQAECNIVVCDDGMMVMLRDNFAAAEMLWENIIETQGRVLKLSKLLQHVPRASRFHLKGLRSRDVYEVFHRMLYYYHYQIGFIARSTNDRRGKFKKASNLNSHLRLALGAQQRVERENISLEQALLEEVHNEDGSQFIMFGNDIRVGHLICVNDADARMAPSVIAKTVPEFLNDKSLGFTQHATKTLEEQRGESYFTNLLAVYTDTLYQGHFLLSSILGCHPPLVGHSVFLRTEAIKQCGRVRTLRKAQQWLHSIGLHFLPVDQVGFGNLQAQNRTEYWSESNVSEDFELMIHLYSLGFNGRYVNYDGCEFQEGITRTFDEEAGRHRKFALGAHELVFHPFQEMLGRGIFTPVFRTFLTCEIPSYYKIFLTAYLCSYASGGSYILVFSVSAILRILDKETDLDGISLFNPAGIIILNFLVYYIVGYVTFIVSLLRMNAINNKLFFKEYRKKWCSACYLVFVQLRYCFVFQFLFYNVTTFTFYFLGSMDHMLARPSMVGTTNKDSIQMSRCRALCDTVSFNIGSWILAILMLALAYLTVLQDYAWNITDYPKTKNQYLLHALFAGPAVVLAILAFVVPIFLNPFILGWPFYRKQRKTATKSDQTKPKQPMERSNSLTLTSRTVDVPTETSFIKQGSDEDVANMDAHEDLHLETGSLTTTDLRATLNCSSPERSGQGTRGNDPPFSVGRNTARLSQIQEFSGSSTSGIHGRRANYFNAESETARLDSALNRSHRSSDGAQRRSVPVRSHSRDGRNGSTRPSGNKSPTISPANSPTRRSSTSISPGRRRQSTANLRVGDLTNDEWGFPISPNITF
jgi:cellulose synthase/poly-beta-1,6-N-acetylglucosamine synthase-like glycosyltransferase